MLQTKFSSHFLLLFAGLSILGFSSCKKSETGTDGVTDPAISAVLNLPATPFNYANLSLPGYLTNPVVIGQINTPGNNPVTDDGATLGRVLFYDKNLSVNNTVACASCHKQNLGFTDNAVKSLGFNGGLTGRHSMGLTDAKYYPNGRFFWDQRAATLEDQVLRPIQDAVEMGMTLTALVAKIKTQAYYPPLFKKAFGDENISSDRISLALSQFVRSIVSYQTKFDVGRAAVPPGPLPPNPTFPNFTAEENRGLQIFLGPAGGCAGCHGTETFTAPGEKNNGLDLTTTDAGFGTVTGNPADNGLFKVGSLRNIELGAPYMHDGRFATLEQVVEHYSSGVKAHPNLSNQLKLPNGQPRLANLSVADKAALVAFLKTLTDQAMVTDQKYSNPFK